MKIQGVIDLMVELAPVHLAADWDNVGLMVGDPSRELRGLAVALDPTHEAVESAIAAGANMLVTHHPLLFKPARSLDLRQEPGRTIQALIKRDVALYAAHTNLDATAVNVALAAKLGLVGTGILDRTGIAPDHKLTVFVPQEAAGRVQEAAWAAGAGRTEGYERTSYQSPVHGTFRPLPGADPAEGAICQQEDTEELRLEFLVPSPHLAAVRQAVLAAHPYEEPAMDAVLIEGSGRPYGYGLVGDLEAPRPLGDLARHVKAALGLPAVRMVGPADRPVKRVAWLGGSGGDYFKKARAAGADVYITGEVRHHAMLDALALGLTFIEVGHVGSEQPVVPFLAEFFRDRLPGSVPIHALDQVDPFTVV